MWIIFLLCFAIFTKAMGQRYVISNEKYNSTEAATACKLAAPPMKITQFGQEVNLTNSNIDSINESIWVGYVMAYSTFVYKGCANSSHLMIINSTVDIRAELGLCYSFCRTTYVGINTFVSETKCYCLGTPLSLDKLLEKDCKEACTDPVGAICGSGEKKHHVSVYEKVNEPSTKPFPGSNESDGRCLAYEPNSSNITFYWRNCSESYQGICQDRYGNVQHADTGNGNVQHADTRWGNWTSRMETCITPPNPSFPVNPSTNLSPVQNITGQLWIGAVRSISICTLSDAVVEKESYLQGYIDTTLQLQFSRLTDLSLLRSLCINSSSITTSSPTRGAEMSRQPSSPPSTPIPPNTTGSSTTLASDINTRSSTETSSQSSSIPCTATSSNRTWPSIGGDKAAQSNDSDDGKVALYVVVPLIAIAIVVALGLFFWQRRKKLPGKRLCSLEDSCSIHHNGTNPSNGMGLSLDASNAEKTDATVRHDYFILEPANEYASIKDTNMDQDDDGDYDITEGAMGNITSNDTGNIYNRLEDVSEDTYNHTNILNIRGDDTYNITGNCANDQTYNTAKTLPRSNIQSKQEGDVDDTYNHIDGAGPNLDHKHETDDTYNTPECDMRDAKQVANAYSYANPSVKTPVVSHDKGNIKYDYAFAEPGVTGGSTKPIRFKVDQQSTAGNYAFATEPSASADYQLAKPPGDY